MSYGPPPPYPPYRPPRRRLPLPAVIALAVLGLAFWGVVISTFFESDSSDGRPAPASSKPRISIAPDETPTPSMDEDMTELVTNLAWDEQSESEKDDMCFGIRVLGSEWAADRMRDSQSHRPEDDVAWEVDWDLAAEILADKCTERGY